MYIHTQVQLPLGIPMESPIGIPSLVVDDIYIGYIYMYTCVLFLCFCIFPFLTCRSLMTTSPSQVTRTKMSAMKLPSIEA